MRVVYSMYNLRTFNQHETYLEHKVAKDKAYFELNR